MRVIPEHCVRRKRFNDSLDWQVEEENCDNRYRSDLSLNQRLSNVLT
jgi:hypothetical protein